MSVSFYCNLCLVKSLKVFGILVKCVFLKQSKLIKKAKLVGKKTVISYC